MSTSNRINAYKKRMTINSGHTEKVIPSRQKSRETDRNLTYCEWGQNQSHKSNDRRITRDVGSIVNKYRDIWDAMSHGICQGSMDWMDQMFPDRHIPLEQRLHPLRKDYWNKSLEEKRLHQLEKATHYGMNSIESTHIYNFYDSPRVRKTISKVKQAVSRDTKKRYR
jgi:hypothetical protein